MSRITLEQKFAKVLVAHLETVTAITDLGKIHTQFDDEKIKLPAIFIKISRDEEEIENSMIYGLNAEVELRYLVKRSKTDEMAHVWGEVDYALTHWRMDAFADYLSGLRDDFICHDIRVADTEPAAREGERHFGLVLSAICATV